MPPSWRPGHGRRTWPFGARHEDVRLSALLDDELSIDEALEVTRHVIACGRCFSEFEAIREARKVLRALPPIEPPQELLSHLLAEPPAAEVSPVSRARRLLSAAAVSIGLVAVTAFTLGDDERGTVAPPVDLFVADHLVRVDDGLMLTPVDLDRYAPRWSRPHVWLSPWCSCCSSSSSVPRAPVAPRPLRLRVGRSSRGMTCSSGRPRRDASAAIRANS